MAKKTLPDNTSDELYSILTGHRPFVGIDGEGGGVNENGQQSYVLLCDSTGASVSNERGLTTTQCLDFLLRHGINRSQQGNGRLRRKLPILVGFSTGYDVTQILRNVPIPTLKRLHETGFCYYGDYRIQWFHRKRFGIQNRRTGVSCTLYDTFGFFQTSFVKALEAYGITAPEIIQRMKQERDTFSWDNIAEITEYCIEECQQLVNLMNRLRRSFDSIELTLKHWSGPGQVAAASMRKEGIKRYMPRDDRDMEIEYALACAYFGGRIESIWTGVETDPVYNYDIRSAYPAAATDLPDANGVWQYVSDYDPTARFAIWKCQWKCDYYPGYFSVNHGIIGPFPYRLDNGNVYYPARGIGWYHAAEVAAAMRLHPGEIDIQHGVIFQPASDCKPFGYLRGLYRERARFRENMDAAEKACKLVLNSTYGKLAEKQRGKYPPAFADRFWAGYITSWTRAKILEAVTHAPTKIIAIATDGIVARQRLDVTDSTSLGGWEVSTSDRHFQLQPGVYCQWRNGKHSVKSRGWHPKDLDWQRLEEIWWGQSFRGSLETTVRIFYGIGLAKVRDRWDLVGAWREEPRRIKFRPSRRTEGDMWKHNIGKYMHPTFPLRLKEENTCSRPYSGATIVHGQIQEAILDFLP